MDTRTVTLWEILNGIKKYRVPPYQRRYSWKQEDWERLWEHIRIQYEVQIGVQDERAPHFFGSVVLQPDLEMGTSITGADIIDGQQRFITTTLLLIAMHDLTTSKAEKKLLKECYENLQRKGDDRWKLQPGKMDYDNFEKIVTGKGKLTEGLLGTAYRWFSDAVKEFRNIDPKKFSFPALREAITHRLEVILIYVDKSDNAHRIFQTLNSTGRSLSQTDLIRNHFFMALGATAEKDYTRYWVPMEEKLGDELEAFFHHYLIGHGQPNTTPDTVYTNYQAKLSKIENSPEEVLAELQLMSKYSKLYEKILDPAKESAVRLRKALHKFNEWGATHQRPLLLRIQTLEDEGKITKREAARCCEYIESYLVRRMLYGVPTNTLNRIFGSIAASLTELRKGFVEELYAQLSKKSRAWPTDEELQSDAENRPFYESRQAKQRQFILRRLAEEISGREIPDWGAAKYTIEHVMPQTLNDAWIESLEAGGAADLQKSHKELLDTLGNLTLTAYNAELSNSSFAKKQQIYCDSNVSMTRDIAKVSQWGADEIKQRSQRLYKIVVTLWKPPEDLREDNDEVLHSRLVVILESLQGKRWTTLEDLASALSCDVQFLREFVTKSDQLPNKEFILSEKGLPELDMPKMAADSGAYRDLLTGAGIFGDRPGNVASPVTRADPDQFQGLQR